MIRVEEQTIIVSGPQGSGKDTQVELLKTYFKEHDPARQVVHFDAGTALRAFAQAEGYTQKIVDASLKRGELQPMFVLADVMADFFVHSMKGDEHLIVSGFPRSPDQLVLFNSAIQFYKRKNPTLLFLSISEEESLRRLLKRGRSDDTEESIRKRLRWSLEQTMPVVEHFRNDPTYTYIEVDGTPSIEEIHQTIVRKLNLV